MEERQQAPSPEWGPTGFQRMLATIDQLKAGEGWVFLRDGIVRLWLTGTFTVTPRGMSIPTPQGISHRSDLSTPWDRISSHADIHEGGRELHVMSRSGVVCIQLASEGEPGRVAFGGGVRVEERASARFPGKSEFLFSPYG